VGRLLDYASMSAIGPRPLGSSGLTVPAIGVGTNRWSGGPDQAGLQQSYSASLDAGTAFFDSAEVYMGGRSERALGTCTRSDPRPTTLATKFAPLPHRVVGAQFSRALDRSLARMGRDSVDLYYLHFPYSLVGMDLWIRALADAVRSGRVRAAGVSNCSAAQMRRAARILERGGVPLAANQVQYSLRHRKPERDGVLQACHDMDVALVAYRPISGGKIATGAPSGGKLEGTLREVAEGHGASVSQISLRWLIQRDELVVAIPGSRSAGHARENAGALGLELSEAEFAAIDQASSTGAR
jgi:aryl-alcohol dehydrogenase-like predicted oxidoreductase